MAQRRESLESSAFIAVFVIATIVQAYVIIRVLGLGIDSAMPVFSMFGILPVMLAALLMFMLSAAAVGAVQWCWRLSTGRRSAE